MVTKGQFINERYQIIRSIGEGGMANVYLAYDTILDRKVAIKVLRGDLSNDEKFVRRFQREALSASSLSHPNIVEMYDVGEDNGLYYIVMEYVEGKTLKQLLKRRGNLTLSEAIDIMLQLTDGMAHAHDSYIIHRDLKPQNIMIEDDGQVKITDFGIAMALNSTQLTQTNSVMGSVHYLPPEQANGKGSTIKSDIYSMGIIFYELLSGSLPFRGDSAVEIALKHMKEPLPNLMDDDSSIPQSIENIILKSTAKNPKNRYDDARSMHQDLLTALDDDRINEEPYKYKYPENDIDGSTKPIKNLSEAKDEIESLDDEDDEKPKKAKKKKKNWWKKLDKKQKALVILGGVAAVIILGLLTTFFVVPALTDKPDVKIPNVKGLKVSTAQDKLEEAGLKVNKSIKKVTSKKVKKNRIVKTDPIAGRTVKKGTKVTLYKSSGEKTYTVENYVGKNYVEVKTKLEEKGLNVTISKKDVEDDTEHDDDEIIGQSVKKGKKLKKGDSITLYIPNNETVFPDMAGNGWTLDDVQAFASKYNLNLNIAYQKTNAYQEGKVVDQSRAPGSPLTKGTNITVTIAQKADEQPKEETKKENTTPVETPEEKCKKQGGTWNGSECVKSDPNRTTTN